MGLLTKNAKMKKSGAKHGLSIFNFTLPALQTRGGDVICPSAGACKKFCYARQGAYVWSNVYAKHKENYEATKLPGFVARMVAEIKSKRGKVVIRIHDAGDFYSRNYAEKWFAIMRECPEVEFYAYTKMVPLFRLKSMREIKPDNFTIIFSEGGKWDSLIREHDRHSRVFTSAKELIAAGYDDASNDDTVAFTSKSGKIGLVYHGAKSKQATTKREAA